MTALINPYCTVREVQDECQNTRPEDIDGFRTHINNASRWIDERCRRDFLFHDHSSTPLQVPLHWMAQNVIFLPWPIVTLTEITVTDPNTQETVTLTTNDFTVETIAGSATSKIYRNCNWRSPDEFTTGLLPRSVARLPRKVMLTGTFGFTPATKGSPAVADPESPAPTLPAEIRQACAIIAAIRSGKARREWVDAMGQRQSASKTKIPEDTVAALCKYELAIV